MGAVDLYGWMSRRKRQFTTSAFWQGVASIFDLSGRYRQESVTLPRRLPDGEALAADWAKAMGDVDRVISALTEEEMQVMAEQAWRAKPEVWRQRLDEQTWCATFVDTLRDIKERPR